MRLILSVASCVSLSWIAVQAAPRVAPSHVMPRRAVVSHSATRLSGHIAFVRDNTAFVVAVQGGRETRLPLGRGVQNVSVSPRDGTVIYSTSLYATEAVKEVRTVPLGLLMSAPPYRVARPVFKKVTNFHFGELQWSGDGRLLIHTSFDHSALFSLAPLAVQSLPFSPDSASQDARVLAVGATAPGYRKQVQVFQAQHKRSKIIFSSQKPQALFDLIRRAKLGPLLDCDNFAGLPLSTPSEYWGFGPAAIAPDGKSVYFATNAGAVVSGAGGNTTFCLVKADIASGQLSLPTHFVWEGARLPYATRVSPDGRRILLVVASHSSAMDNSSQAYCLDLKTRKMTRLLTGKEAPSDTQANLMVGDCWSPDGRFVALSIFNYDPRKITESDAEQDANYTLFIKEVATGRTIRTIKGAISPSWGA